MIKAVLDTNILISAIFWRGKEYLVLKKGIQGKYQITLSAEILEELIQKLDKKFKMPKDKIEEHINLLLTYSELIEPNVELDFVRDKTDNKIIECAYASEADFIVTGDSDLLVLKKFGKTKIIRSHKFLEEI